MAQSDTLPTRPTVFCGLDVGKEAHHATALDAEQRRLLDRALPNSEPALRQVFSELLSHGSAVVVVDESASIGALPIAVARSMGLRVAYLPGLALRRIADIHPSEGKTDARDAYVIADAARTMPHLLRRIDGPEDNQAGLQVLAGYDADLAAQSTRLTNRLRDALLHVHPALERLLGRHIHRGGVLTLLTEASTPAAVRVLGGAGMRAVLRPCSPRLAATLPEQMLTALGQQTVTVPGTGEFGRVIAGLARQLGAVLDERAALAETLEAKLAAHPLAAVLTSLPGVGVKTAITVLVTVGGASGFASAAHLAAYAGLAPVTRRSGSSIRGESRSRRGNRTLKTALYLSAFASLSDPVSRTYYDRKRAEGKRHQAAPLCLARRRTDVLFAMLRDRKPYQAPSSADRSAATAA